MGESPTGNVRLGKVGLDLESCAGCRYASGEGDKIWRHCTSVRCVPLVAQSKKGVVINFISNSEDIVSVDLIPLFPLRAKLIDLYFLIPKTLLQLKPVGWKAHLSKYVIENRPTRQRCKELAEEGETDNLVAMKAINYEDEGALGNFIIEPGQSTGLENMDDERLRGCYTFLKYLVKRLDIGMKSYVLKKLVFNDEMVSFNATFSKDDSFCRSKLLLAVLSQLECRRIFEHSGVDFSALEASTEARQLDFELRLAKTRERRMEYREGEGSLK